MRTQIYASVDEVESACIEYLASHAAARKPLERGVLSRCLAAEQRLIELVTRKHPNDAERNVSDPVPMTIQQAGAVVSEFTDERIVEVLEASGVEFQRFMGGIGGTKDCWSTAGSQSVRKIAAGVRAVLALSQGGGSNGK